MGVAFSVCIILATLGKVKHDRQASAKRLTCIAASHSAVLVKGSSNSSHQSAELWAVSIPTDAIPVTALYVRCM